MYQIEIESTPCDGYEHVIVRGRSGDADPELFFAMERIRNAMYAGHSVHERTPLEHTVERDFATMRKTAVAYCRFYRCAGPEFVRPIDRALGEVVGSAWFKRQGAA